jgi:hypothetical protein
MQALYGTPTKTSDMPESIKGVISKKMENGIVQVVALRCTMNNLKSKYKNDVFENYVMYCKPPMSDRQCMEYARDNHLSIPLYIISGSANFFYGNITISNYELEDKDSGNERYHLLKMDSLVPNNSQTLKRRRISTECNYSNIMFKSLLEGRWAKFLDLIHVRWEYESLGIMMSSGSTYWPDFYISFPFFAYIEIKPDEPPDDAQLKCEETCRKTGIPVYLFYKDKFKSIFAKEGRDYSWSNGIRAMCWKREGENVIFDESKYVWMKEGDNFIIDKRRNLSDMRYIHLEDLFNQVNDDGIEILA